MLTYISASGASILTERRLEIGRVLTELHRLTVITSGSENKTTGLAAVTGQTVVEAGGATSPEQGNSETDRRNPILSALLELLRAHEYAVSMQRDVWDFAIELPHLNSTGLTISDIRWLAYSGLIHPAEEVESSWEAGRRFRSHSKFRLSPASCFVLTPAGVVMASQAATGCLPEGGVLGGLGEPLDKKTFVYNEFTDSERISATDSKLLLPEWDRDRRQLRLAGEVVKNFKLPSPNQEAILSAFAEEGWPTRIDDPLPPVSHMNRKRRLLDTIKSLNRHQKVRSLRFMGDGRGEGVVWELIAAPPAIES